MAEATHHDQIRSEIDRRPAQDVADVLSLLGQAMHRRADAVPGQIGGQIGAGLRTVPLE